MPENYQQEQNTNEANTFLAQSEAFLGAMFDCSKQGLVITDIDLTVVRYNMMAELLFESLFSIRLGETPSLRLLRLTDRTFPIMDLLQHAGKNEAYSIMASEETEEKPKQCYQIQIQQIYDASGNQLGNSLTMTNVTGIKQMECNLTKTPE